MSEADGIRFLQWCLPRLHLRWPGFRKVRRQVYKRIDRRLQQLGLAGLGEYRGYLEHHAEEWPVLDTLCWISISRFYRDKAVFAYLQRDVLPQVACAAIARGDKGLHCWSAGCAAGEEPYTLAVLWKQCLAAQFAELTLHIVATDIDPHALFRAEHACYPASSLHDLPPEWVKQAFTQVGQEFCLRPEYGEAVSFQQQDIREIIPDNLFDLILCRYLVFTYFDGPLQQQVLRRICDRLVVGGILVIGVRESLPAGGGDLEPLSSKLGVYQKIRQD